MQERAAQDALKILKKFKEIGIELTGGNGVHGAENLATTPAGGVLI